MEFYSIGCEPGHWITSDFGIRLFHGDWVFILINTLDEEYQRVAVFTREGYYNGEEPYLVRHCPPDQFCFAVRDIVNILEQEHALAETAPF